jgi:hypothetical protein
METFLAPVRPWIPVERGPVWSIVSCIIRLLHLYSDALLDARNADSGS